MPAESVNHKAVRYGEVKIIPGVVCDAYILDNGQAVLSLRSFSDLLGMDHESLRVMAGTWPPKTLEAFWNKAWTMSVTFAAILPQSAEERKAVE